MLVVGAALRPVPSEMLNLVMTCREQFPVIPEPDSGNRPLHLADYANQPTQIVARPLSIIR